MPGRHHPMVWVRSAVTDLSYQVPLAAIRLKNRASALWHDDDRVHTVKTWYDKKYEENAANLVPPRPSRRPPQRSSILVPGRNFLPLPAPSHRCDTCGGFGTVKSASAKQGAWSGAFCCMSSRYKGSSAGKCTECKGTGLNEDGRKKAMLGRNKKIISGFFETLRSNPEPSVITKYLGSVDATQPDLDQKDSNILLVGAKLLKGSDEEKASTAESRASVEEKFMFRALIRALRARFWGKIDE
jgi:hypothetical protein